MFTNSYKHQKREKKLGSKERKGKEGGRYGRRKGESLVRELPCKITRAGVQWHRSEQKSAEKDAAA
jgi:hypothetical protein